MSWWVGVSLVSRLVGGRQYDLSLPQTGSASGPGLGGGPVVSDEVIALLTAAFL